MGKTVNKAQLEEIVGLSHQTLTDYQAEGMPILARGARGEENQYDTAEVIAWLVKRALARAGKTESQRDRESRLRGDLMELELAEKNNVLVPADQVRPIWENRILTAAAFMAGRASRLAGELEATPGLEAKRAILKKEDAEFLTRLGVDGERMQAVLDEMLQKLAAGEADAFLRRIAGHDEPKRNGDSAQSPPGGVG